MKRLLSWIEEHSAETYLLFYVSFLSFFPAWFFREYAYGTDSFYYLSLLGLPWSVAVIVLAASFFLSNLVVFAIAEKYFPRRGWIAPIACFLSPLWLFFFLNFENDVFIMPLLLASMYFALKKNWKMVLACLVPAGLVFKGAFVFLIAYAFFYPLFWLPVAFGLFMYSTSGLSLLPNFNSMDSSFFWGAVLLGFLWIGFAADKKRPYFWLSLPFLALVFVQIKFAVFVIPLLALGVLDFAKHARNKNLIHRGLLLLTLGFFIATLLLIPKAIPTSEDIDLVRVSVPYSRTIGVPLMNTWPVGHWLNYFFPGFTHVHSGGIWVQDFRGSLVLAHRYEGSGEFVPGPFCQRVDEADNVILWLC